MTGSARWFLASTLLAVGCSASSPPSAPSGRVEIVAAPPTGDVAAYVAAEVAADAHVPVLVYVGATWCEPCRDFHAAVAAGSLDAELGPLRLLEFDLDRDDQRLAAAGYRSAYVPLFVRPDRDGRASPLRSEGVKKGQNYVEQLTPRVRAVVGDRP